MQNESWRERWEKEFSKVKFIEFDKGAWSHDVKKYHDKEIMAFITSELNLAKQECRSQLLQEIGDIINSTSDDSDKLTRVVKFLNNN